MDEDMLFRALGIQAAMVLPITGDIKTDALSYKRIFKSLEIGEEIRSDRPPSFEQSGPATVAESFQA